MKSGALLQELDLRAVGGDRTAALAADTIRRLSRGGRPRIDDGMSHTEMAMLLERGEAKSRWDAAWQVAGSKTAPNNRDSLARRLYRGFRSQKP